MRKRSWFRTLGLSATLILLVAAMCDARGHRVVAGQAFLPYWWERSGIVKQLDLSEEQLAAVREIASSQTTKIRVLRESLRDEEDALKALLIRETLEDREIDHRLDALGTALSALLRAEMDMNITMAREMTADQRARLLPLIESLRLRGACADKKQHKRTEGRYHRF